MSAYEFSLTKSLTVGSAQDFIMRFNPPVPVRPGRVSVEAPRHVITVSECFMGGEDMRIGFGIHGFGIDAAELQDKVFKALVLGPSAGVSLKCWYNGDEPEGYRTGERLVIVAKFSGVRVTLEPGKIVVGGKGLASMKGPIGGKL